MMKVIAALVLLFTLGGNVFGQAYEVCVENDALISPNAFEFDVCIKSTSTTFELTSYQCAFTYYSKITNGGSLSFSYVPGSSDINNLPNFGVGINNLDGIKKITFASMPGNDLIDTLKKKIGRFRLTNTSSFGPFLSKIINLEWNFDGIVSTILTGDNFANITNPSNHISRMEGLNKENINLAYASDTSNAANHPGKTLDGLGYYDNDSQSLWKAQPTPQWIIFDLGLEKAVSLTRFSFQNFNSGRKYIYSISVSANNTNWTDVVPTDTSDLIEYTENEFQAVMARFIKLTLISNNQNQTAAVWEAEIWGGDQILPVELNSFQGFLEKNNVILEWKTSSELNNHGFEIERKSGNSDFIIVGFVSGSGTSTEIKNYSFRDNDLNPRKYSYRLKQIDLNNNYKYSNIVELEVLETFSSYQLQQNYPNPFNPKTNISFSLPNEGNVKLEVFNIIGEKVAELIDSKMPAGKHEITFNGESLSSGIYLYRLDVENQFTDVRKMILMK